MKSLLLLLTGAGIGIAAYVLFSSNSAAMETAGWGTKERVFGSGNSLKGSLKENVGELTGDRQTEADGLLDRAKGAAQDVVGSVAQDVGKALNNAG